MKSQLIGLLLLLPLVGAEPAGYKYWSAAELKSLAKVLPNKSDAKTSSENMGNFGVDHALTVHRRRLGRGRAARAGIGLDGDRVGKRRATRRRNNARRENHGPGRGTRAFHRRRRAPEAFARRHYSHSPEDAAPDAAGSGDADHVFHVEGEGVVGEIILSKITRHPNGAHNWRRFRLDRWSGRA